MPDHAPSPPRPGDRLMQPGVARPRPRPESGRRPARPIRRRARSRSSRRFRLTADGRRQQMIATNRGRDGSISDATRSVEWVVRDPAIASVSSKGRVVPLRNGDDDGHRAARQHRDRTRLTVEGMDRPAPVSFRRDVIPAFSQAGMQHGRMPRHPTGKGGSGSACAATCPTRTSHPLPRGGRPSDQPDGRRDQPAPPQAAGRGAPRGRPAARRGTPRPTSSCTTGSRRAPRTTPAPRRPSGWRSCPRAAS